MSQVVPLSPLPRVTVLMPVFNGEAYIAEAVNAVLKQSYRDFHLLVLNDGSTDKTLEALAQFADDGRLQVHSWASNRGAPSARNLGLDLVETELLAFTDSDDRCLPNWLAETVAYLDQHPEVSVLGCTLRYIDAQGAFMPDRHWPLQTQHEQIVCQMLAGSPIPNIAVVIRSRALQGVRYDCSFLSGQDYAFWVALMLKGQCRFANLRTCLAHYRQHTGQISSAKKLEQQSNHLRVYEMQLRALGLDCAQSDLLRHAALFGFAHDLDASVDAGAGFDADFLDWAYVWLYSIYDTNLQVQIYPPKALKKLLSSRWRQACKAAYPRIGHVQFFLRRWCQRL